MERAKSGRRPLTLHVRKRHLNISSDGSPSSSLPPSLSVSEEIRRAAVVNAAQSRKKKSESESKVTSKVKLGKLKSKGGGSSDEVASKPSTDTEKSEQSEECKAAVSAVKRDEKKLAAKLGYDPYSSVKTTAGKAKIASERITHGDLIDKSEGGSESAPCHQEVGAPQGVPRGASVAAPSSSSLLPLPPSPSPSSSSSVPYPPREFLDALALLMSQGDAGDSLSLCTKLLKNACTKGQEEGMDKYLSVKCSNKRVEKAIEVDGALQMLLSAGFAFTEADGETVLEFPRPMPNPWALQAVGMMEDHERLQKT